MFIYRARGISPAARPPMTVQSRCSLLLICVTGLSLLLLLLLLARHAETLENKTARSMAIRRCCRAQSPSFVLQTDNLYFTSGNKPLRMPLHPLSLHLHSKCGKNGNKHETLQFFWFSFPLTSLADPGALQTLWQPLTRAGGQQSSRRETITDG